MEREIQPDTTTTFNGAVEAPFLEAENQVIKNFQGANILCADQFNCRNLEIVFAEATEMKTLVKTKGIDNILSNYVLATLFYEPSTRTRLSFDAAMNRLGGRVISESSIEFSSAIKGEVLPDTIRVVEGYADVIALRHNEVGSAKTAADYAEIPIINAGDGPGEHPTQALLDIYTIRQRFDQIDDLTITFLGDLRYGRTVHSLARLLANYNVEMNFVAPEYLQMPENIISALQTKGIKTVKADKLEKIDWNFDIIYVTRLQEERFDDDFGPQKLALLKNSYDLPNDFIEKSRALIMHPLPRTGELPPETDQSDKAIYFEQSRNGLFVRMALLKLVLKGE